MRFEKAVMFSVVFAMLSGMGSGCQKAGEKPQAGMETRATQVETADRPSAEGAMSTIESQPSAASEPQVGGEQFAVTPPAQVGNAGLTQENVESDDDEGISLGRMVGGMFRAARSLAPLPAPASSDRRTDSADQAPAFPQP